MSRPLPKSCGLAALCLALLLPAVGRADVNDMLFVVGNSGALTSGESARRSGFEMFGYTVTVIDDGASQASFDLAAASNNFAWVSPDVTPGTLGTKLKNATIGVVNEELDLADEFGFCTSSVATSSKSFLAIQNNTHYITYGLSTGDVTIVTSNQTFARRTGSLASGAVNLASVENTPGNDSPGLLVLEVGAALSGGGTAAGRRVLLPIGSAAFSINALNTSGQRLFIRSMEWAARPNPALGAVLMTVTSTSTPTTQETLRRQQIDVWGYDITLIDDDANQAAFTAAFVGQDAVYNNEEVSASSIGTKLTNCPIGVVNEERLSSTHLAYSSTNAEVSTTSLNITNNSHAITSPFSTGALTIFSSNQPAVTLTGTIAGGMQQLGTVSSARSLAVIESGGMLTNSTSALGRRVQLPFGGSAFDFNALNANGRTIMRRAIAWAAEPVGPRLLLVVKDAGALSSQETSRISLLQSWGYSVTTIDDDASQASFDAAVAASVVAYVTEEVASGSIGSKLATAKIGVVNEEAFIVQQMGFATSQSSSSQTSLNVIDANHYITSTLGAGAKTLFTSAQPVTNLAGTYASGSKVLGEWSGARALVTIEEGARLLDGTSAPGRRVQLPWGDTALNFSSLNANGQTILQRSLRWATGLVGHWKLDETSGTLAYDSSPNGLNATLAGGQTFASHSIAGGKVGRGLDFNGSAHYASVANTSALQLTQALSISAWIKGDSWGSSTYVNSILRKGDANPNNYQLAVANGRLEALLDGNDGGGYTGQTVLQAGRWYHVAMTWDGDKVRLYVDGVLDNNPPPTRNTPISTDTRALFLGGRTGSTDFFDGSLDDVRLYNYALGSSEVQALKGMGSAAGIRITKWRETR